MKKINVINQSGNSLDVELIFAFHCKKTNKNYVALDSKKNVFEKNKIF